MASKRSAAQGRKGKRGAGKDSAPAPGPEVVRLSVAKHPRAARQVRTAKGLGGLAAFAATAYLSLSAGVPIVQTGVRALACGMVGYLLAWACSVSIWRQLMLAELRVHHERAQEIAAKQAAMALPLPEGAVAAASPGSSPGR
jgi:hypothetical protein